MLECNQDLFGALLDMPAAATEKQDAGGGSTREREERSEVGVGGDQDPMLPCGRCEHQLARCAEQVEIVDMRLVVAVRR